MSEAPDTPLDPSRPSHPDYARLQEIVLQLDGAVNADPASGVVGGMVSAIIDDESVVTTAFQRAMQAMLTGSRNGLTVGAGLYLEGFVTGYRFRDRYGGESKGG